MFIKCFTDARQLIHVQCSASHGAIYMMVITFYSSSRVHAVHEIGLVEHHAS
jgi:hypothetical protein